MNARALVPAHVCGPGRTSQRVSAGLRLLHTAHGVQGHEQQPGWPSTGRTRLVPCSLTPLPPCSPCSTSDRRIRPVHNCWPFVRVTCPSPCGHTQVATNDACPTDSDGTAQYSCVTATVATVDTVYAIRVDGIDGGEGNVVLTVTAARASHSRSISHSRSPTRSVSHTRTSTKSVSFSRTAARSSSYSRTPPKSRSPSRTAVPTPSTTRSRKL